MTLREKLIVLREKAGISQMSLAHQLDVSRQAVSRWESGDTTPSMDKLKALAKIYGVSLDWLCSDASDAGALVQEKNLDERDPVCNSELPTEDKPKKRKKWAIIIGVINVRSQNGATIVGYAEERTGEGAFFVNYRPGYGILNEYYRPSAQTDNDATKPVYIEGKWRP